MKATGIVRKVDELGRIVLPIELRRTLNIEIKDPLEIYVDGESIMLKKYQPALICATQGKNGSIAYYKGQSFCQKAFIRKDTVETTGAGDTFMACVLNSVLEKGLNNLTESDILHMLKFASAASSIITTKRGALKVMPQKEDIIVFLNNYSCNMPNL